MPFTVLFQQASTAEQAVINITKRGNFERKCTKMRLAAGYNSDPLGLPRPPSPEVGPFAARGEGRQEPLRS